MSESRRPAAVISKRINGRIRRGDVNDTYGSRDVNVGRARFSSSYDRRGTGHVDERSFFVRFFTDVFQETRPVDVTAAVLSTSAMVRQ